MSHYNTFQYLTYVAIHQPCLYPIYVILQYIYTYIVSSANLYKTQASH